MLTLTPTWLTPFSVEPAVLLSAWRPALRSARPGPRRRGLRQVRPGWGRLPQLGGVQSDRARGAYSSQDIPVLRRGGWYIFEKPL